MWAKSTRKVFKRVKFSLIFGLGADFRVLKLRLKLNVQNMRKITCNFCLKFHDLHHRDHKVSKILVKITKKKFIFS